MLHHQAGQPDLYLPGPFWRGAANNAADHIRAYGLSDFRGRSNAIGWGYTDNAFYETESPALHHAAIIANPRLPKLLADYVVPESMHCGCIDSIYAGGRQIARGYLNALDVHDHLAGQIDFTRINSMMEIGGGFGVNIHILLANYPNVRKVAYLDVPPNLYVGCQYLRMFYPEAIRDYRETHTLQQIRFRDDGSLEIIAMTPWQITAFAGPLDLFYNANSFVEMPSAVVANYAERVQALPAKQIALVTYGSSTESTLHPDRLPTFWPRRTFNRTSFPALDRRFDVIAFTS